MELYDLLTTKNELITPCGSRFAIHQEGTILGHNNLTACLLPPGCNMTNYMHRPDGLNSSEKILFELPIVRGTQHFDLTKFESIKIEVDQRFYRHLSLRMKLPKNSMEDLYNYARTYVQTTIYTQSGFHSRLANLSNYCREAVACVYFEHMIKNEAMLNTISRLEKSWSDDWHENIKSNLATNVWIKLAQLWEWLGVETKTIEQFKSVSSQCLPSLLLNYIKNLPRLKITRINLDPVLIKLSDGSGDELLESHYPSSDDSGDEHEIVSEQIIEDSFKELKSRQSEVRTQKENSQRDKLNGDMPTANENILSQS